MTGRDGSAHVWPTRDEGPISEIRDLLPQFTGEATNIEETTRCVTFSPDSRSLLTGHNDSTAKLRDAVSGKLRVVVTAEGYVDSVLFAADGKTFFTAGRDKFVRQWDAVTGREVRRFAGTAVEHNSLCLTDGGARLLAIGWNDGSKGDLVRWDVGTGGRLPYPPGGPPIDHLAVAPGGKNLLAREYKSGDNARHEWHLLSPETGRPVAPPAWLDPQPLTASVSPRGDRVLFVAADASAVVHHLATGRKVQLVDRVESSRAHAWSPDGTRLVEAGGSIVGVRLWDTTTGQELPPLRDKHRITQAAAWSPDGSKVAVTSFETTWLWSAPPTAPRRLGRKWFNPTAVAFSADGRRLFVWGGYDGMTCSAWDARTGKSVAPTDPPAKPAPGPAVSPDGTLRAEVRGAFVEVTDVIER